MCRGQGCCYIFCNAHETASYKNESMAPNVSSAEVENPMFRECSLSVDLEDLHILHEDNILRGRVKQKISKAFSC